MCDLCIFQSIGVSLEFCHNLPSGFHVKYLNSKFLENLEKASYLFICREYSLSYKIHCKTNDNTAVVDLWITILKK